MRISTTVLLAAATAALAAPATAQPYGSNPYGQRAPSATFYEQPDFRGRSVTIDGESRNMTVNGFNDRARSARFDGRWRICEDSEFRGRCETVSGSVRDLRTYQLDGRVSSARSEDYGQPDYGRPGYPSPAPGGPGGGWGDERGAEGRNVVFYATPRMNGVDIWGSGKMAADAFCRRMGHSTSVYFDISQRAARSQDVDGRFYNNSTVLRDVLCRR